MENEIQLTASERELIVQRRQSGQTEQTDRERFATLSNTPVQSWTKEDIAFMRMQIEKDLKRGGYL